MEKSTLDKILEQHKLWLETNGKQGEGAILGGADLRGANLTSANLRGANLTSANLMAVYLEDADLRGADLTGANLGGANLSGADLTGAILGGAYITGANLTGTNGLPDISWVIPGCLVQLNEIRFSFYLFKEHKWVNFIKDSIGMFIQNNLQDNTFDLLAGERIIRNIPNWVKYSGMKKVTA